eukprot:TRINITY_DN7818_c0_g1_i1.p1 TRINITY_DN7818_c0_g1~~TRINITY_DN7818_c0_g1_i1.p1  ORF type:complete len:436 (-),score=74.36 TRINITY_DN7818_c0_g1_i1:106-1413(-)
MSECRLVAEAMIVRDHIAQYDQFFDEVENVFELADGTLHESFQIILAQVQAACDYHLEKLDDLRLKLKKPNIQVEDKVIQSNAIGSGLLILLDQEGFRRKKWGFSMIGSIASKLISYVDARHNWSHVSFKMDHKIPSEFSLPWDPQYLTNFVWTGKFPITRNPKTIQTPIIDSAVMETGIESFPSMNGCWGIAWNPNNQHILVTSQFTNTILEFDDQLKFVYKHGPALGDDIVLNQPRGIAFSPDGFKLIIVDNANNRLLICDPNLKVVKIVGDYGQNKQKMSYPQNVAFDKDGNFYLSIGGSRTVAKYNKEDECVWTYPPPGNRDNFDWPWAITVSDMDRVIVTIAGKNLISLDLDGGDMKRIPIDYPLVNFDYLARGPDRGIVLANHTSNRICFFDDSYNCTHQIEAKQPVGCTFDSQQRFYVSIHGGSVKIF